MPSKLQLLSQDLCLLSLLAASSLQRMLCVLPSTPCENTMAECMHSHFMAKHAFSPHCYRNLGLGAGV